MTQQRLVTGRACLPDGSPATGAVVTTSAGGKTVVDADGSFAIAVDVPLEAESLEVTALLDEATGESLVASAHLVPAALSPTTSVGQLVLVSPPSCWPRWQPTFGGMPGTHGSPRAFSVHDDGSGAALYAGGSFTSAGGVSANRVAKWDGSSWSALGSGMNDWVESLTVYDDGTGPALYAGGLFTSAGGMPANHIAKWDGSTWAALGNGVVSGSADPGVRALAVYDDGSGAALFVGGYFTFAGGVQARGIAKWDGSSWSALGSGVTGLVQSLAVYDDGSGAALYVGGEFSSAGGVTAHNIAKWDGATWSALGNGRSWRVNALTVYDDGGGPALHAGENFGAISKWDGSSWTELGGATGGILPTVHALAVHDDGGGPALYAGGNFTSAGGVPAKRIAKWDGATWSPLDDGMSSPGGSPYVFTLAVYDAGSGPALYAGGLFARAGDVALDSIARWEASSWTALGSGMTGTVEALAEYDDGGGAALYAAGTFLGASGVTVNGIARWDGSSWSALGGGVSNPSVLAVVHALATYDAGSGPELYAAGFFSSPGTSIARWDGTIWSAVGTGVCCTAMALTVHDEGSGPALYVGGNFSVAGGQTVNRIARWNGSSWSPVGSGLGNNSVSALAVYDSGSGPELYAGGDFTLPTSAIAKWDGSSWSSVGGGMSGGLNTAVNALAVFDDGTGSALYAGGEFTSAGGVTALRIAKWDGTSWSALGGGLGESSFHAVHALTVFDPGSGPALFAGGLFGKKIASWDGSSWTTVGIGIDGTVKALASWDAGGERALYAGGEFGVSPEGDSFLAKWGCRTKPTVKKRRL